MEGGVESESKIICQGTYPYILRGLGTMLYPMLCFLQ